MHYLKTIITPAGSFALDAEKEAHLKIMDYTVKVAMHLFTGNVRFKGNMQVVVNIHILGHIALFVTTI